MNTPNPLVPQGSLLEQKAKSKPNLPMIVFVLVAIHVVIFGGMLMSGCKRDPAKDQTAAATTNSGTLPVMTPDTNTATITPPTPVPVPVPVPSPNVANTVPMVTSNTVVPPTTPGPSDTAPAAPKKYTVVKGDSFSKIAGKFNVSVSALEKANEGVDPKKLQIGKELNIPASEGKSTAAATSAPDTGSGDAYVVKSGDALEKIAKAHGTTVKAIEELNGLTSSKIKVGQKLKMPAGSKPAAAPATDTTTAPPTTK